MNNQQYAQTVVTELNHTLTQIDVKQSEDFVEKLLQSDEIFVAGAGRSGYMARGFCMRLMHMGFKSYMVGDTITPNIKPGDLLVICSGSGETKSLLSMAEKAKSLGVQVALVTINPESTIAKLADSVVRINAPSPKAVKQGDFASIQPMGSLFEQSLLLYLDIVIMLLMDKKGLDSTTMFGRHANLE